MAYRILQSIYAWYANTIMAGRLGVYDAALWIDERLLDLLGALAPRD